ncbi:MAG: hypothetical protein MUP70_11990, partial [Candidatus Aminicenantes bacterium]|nr:hypothetical protein [Candidatus Aminicenantes bacterium]
MKKYFITSLIVLLSFFISIPAAPQAVDWDKDAVTKHTLRIDGKDIRYTARAGFLPIVEEDKTTAQIFYIAYTRDDTSDPANRPVTFSFNGGPGSSSIWMHMAFLGPRKVLYDDEGFALQPPYRLADNEFSILDATDLVFIDPAATGFSRMMPGEDPHKYHGVMEDIASVGEFIRLYVTRNNRWGSPKFIIGESYGTTRASGLTGYLQDQHRMYINGTILVSMTALGYSAGGDLSLMTILPHYTATAWFHKQLSADLQAKPLREVLDEAEMFATGPYTLALIRGNTLSPEEKDKVATEMARLTGLDKGFLLKSDLRVSAAVFRRHLLSEEGLTVGRLDSRYTGVEAGSPEMAFRTDPAMESWNGPFTGAVNQYFHQELGVRFDMEYNVFGDVRPWKGRNDAFVGQMLHRALIQNPYLNVMVLEGYYDGACDYFTAQYTFSHLDLAGKIKDRIHFRYYECGHMMYIRKPDLA